MAKYDPKSIDQVSTALVSAANVLLAGFVLVGVLVGYAFGSAAGSISAPLVMALIVGCASGIVAYPFSVLLKAFAQLLLSQVEIEANTRNASGRRSA